MVNYILAVTAEKLLHEELLKCTDGYVHNTVITKMHVIRKIRLVEGTLMVSSGPYRLNACNR